MGTLLLGTFNIEVPLQECHIQHLIFMCELNEKATNNTDERR